MKIAIRVDASIQIGTGHFVRCMTLADALRQSGAQIRFVSRNLPEYLRDSLTAKGYDFVLLDSRNNNIPLDHLAHAHWLGVSQSQDASDTMQALSDGNWDWLIVDHYALDSSWETKLRQVIKKILVIDDIADRQHDCDVLLDQNFYEDMEARYAGKISARCKLLLGPRYALLREEFRLLHEKIEPRNGTVKRILVFFGGVDADNYTGSAIEALSDINRPSLQVDVVIGAQHPCREQIKASCAQHRFICHVQTDKMAELMAMADLAIGAGGTATWERCCVGLPALSFCVADNQQKQIVDAAKEGYLYSPAVNADLIGLIKRHTIALLENDHLLSCISHKSMHAVDGRGVLRLVSNMGCGGVVMRKASAGDSAKLFEWRNHPSIRCVSRNSEPIAWEDHQKWFSSVMCSTDRVLLVGQKDDVTVGVVRFDKQGEDAEVSIYLIPDANQSGQGRNLLLSAEQWVKENRPDIKYVRASVLGSNLQSQRLFLGVGYQVEVTHYLKKL